MTAGPDSRHHLPARAPAATRSGGAGDRTTAPVPRHEFIRLNQVAERFFRDHLRGSWAPSYLTDRGFTPAVQQRWHTGYAPATWNALTRHLRRLGCPPALIEACGLARRSRHGTLIDTFRDRAMFPVYTGGGALAGFTGRAPTHAPPGTPKYFNSPRTSIYDKRSILFGLWQARDALAHGARPVLAEGPLDAIAITTAGAGRHAGLSPCGTAFTSHHAAALARTVDLREIGVLVAFDADPAGQRAAVRAYYLLTPYTTSLAAVTFQPGHDPAQLLAEHGPAALERTIQRDVRPLADLVIDAEIQRWSRWLHYPEGRVNALRAAAHAVAAMPTDQVARQAARLSTQLGLSHQTVTMAITEVLPDVIGTARTSFTTRPGQATKIFRRCQSRYLRAGT
jgi:DNA primase catalytic core